MDPDPINQLRQAKQRQNAAQQELEMAVHRARQEGVTWQSIGEVLGVSKQAAAQRFNPQKSPLSPESLQMIENQLNAAAEEFFRGLAHKNLSTVQQNMTYLTKRLLSQRKIFSTWRQVIDACGDFQEITRTVIETNRPEAAYVLTYRLRHRHGEPVGQLAFNTQLHITGWVIYLDDSAQLPW